MLELEVLVSELLTVDGLTPSAIASGKISTLTHEVWNHAVEGRTLETKALLPRGKGAEVLGRLRCHICLELHLDTAPGLTANCDVEACNWVIGMGGKPWGRIEMELKADVTPK